MPIFEYECKVCSIRKEKLVRNSDIEMLCPKCYNPMRKLISACAFVLKGEGFFSPGSNPRSKIDGPHISNELKEMPDIELNRSLGLQDDHS